VGAERTKRPSDLGHLVDRRVLYAASREAALWLRASRLGNPGADRAISTAFSCKCLSLAII
jgi:hypothetical protein